MGGGELPDIQMVEDASLLDEVVVVGYGTQKKENLTGTVNTISSDQLTGKASTSLAQAMQGVTPGVTVIARPGDVGSVIGNIQIRGRGNLGSSAPLYVVDGTPVSSGEFQRLQPNDIESISVLKDAAASAIYGARAAFGVILVTTKKGKEGKASFSYNGYYSLSSPTVVPDFVGAYDYANLYNEAQTNAGKPIRYKKEELQYILDRNKPDLYPDNDWYKIVYQDYAPMYEHNLNLSGGGKTRYFVSGTISDQESLIPNKELKKYSFRAKAERNFTDNFKLGTNVNFIKEDYNRGGDFSVTDLNRMTPMTVAKHSDGSWGTVTAGQEETVLAENNPLRKLYEYGRGKYNSTRLNASINANWEPIKDLNINGQISYRQYNYKSSNFKNKVPKLTGFITKELMSGTEVSENQLDAYWNQTGNLMSQFYATYHKAIDLHDFNLMAGFQYEKQRREWIGAYRKDFPSNELDVLDAGSSEKIGNNGNTQEDALVSEYARLNYAFDGKYLFEANIRFDKSSRFPEEERLGVFPSFSAAWRVSQEDFMANVDWINELKIRASWGQAGNIDNVGYYDYQDQLGLGGAYVTGGIKADGVWPSKQPNSKLGWETVTQTNIGIDTRLFNNSLNVQLDVYDKKTTDILLKLPQPAELGVKGEEQLATNAGVVSNRGIEAIVNYTKFFGDVKVTIGGNLSKVWNKVEDLKGLGDIKSGNFIYKEGEAIGSFYGYQALGIYKDQAEIDNTKAKYGSPKPGDVKYADINGDGKITADDRTIIGNDVPYFTYGLNLGVNYKGFDLAVQGQGVKDVKVYLSGEESQAFFNGAGAKSYVKGRWTEANPNPNAPYPRLLPTGDNRRNTIGSSFWLFNADYFRIKNIILGYTIPQNITQKYGIENLRIFVSAVNYVTFSSDKRLSDFDPEMASTRGTYPNLKTISFGLNLSF